MTDNPYQSPETEEPSEEDEPSSGEICFYYDMDKYKKHQRKLYWGFAALWMFIATLIFLNGDKPVTQETLMRKVGAITFLCGLFLLLYFNKIIRYKKYYQEPAIIVSSKALNICSRIYKWKSIKSIRSNGKSLRIDKTIFSDGSEEIYGNFLKDSSLNKLIKAIERYSNIKVKSESRAESSYFNRVRRM